MFRSLCPGRKVLGKRKNKKAIHVPWLFPQQQDREAKIHVAAFLLKPLSRARQGKAATRYGAACCTSVILTLRWLVLSSCPQQLTKLASPLLGQKVEVT